MPLLSKADCIGWLAVALLVSGCVKEQIKPVPVPVVVTKTVTQEVERVVQAPVALPDWAKEQVPNAPPSKNTLEGLKAANDARASTLDYVNCRARLLAKLDKGLKASIKECR